MKTTLSNAVANIDDRYISEAASFTAQNRISLRTRAVKWGAVAACAAIVAVAAVVITSKNNKITADTPDRSIPSQDSILPRPYEKNVSMSEIGIVYPWDYKTEAERWSTVTLNGAKFRTMSSAPLADESTLGDNLGTFTAEGYDIYTDTTYTQEVETRAIKGTDSRYAAAVKLSDGWYVIRTEDTDAPKTMAELFSIYGLKDKLRLSHFTEENDGRNDLAFTLTDSKGLTDKLANLGNTTFVGENGYSRPGNSLAFTVNIPELGIYNKVLRIYEDGTLTTNAFEYAFAYNIGEENARQLIDYAKAHAETAEENNTRGMIGGKIVEIGEGYIKIDDTDACIDPAQGKVFTVKTEDVRIKRAAEYPHELKVGDTVAVYFDGGIDKECNISGAYELAKATIDSHGVNVAE